MLFEDETSYEGTFADAGVFSGHGTLSYNNGDRMEGSFYGNYTEGMKFSGTIYKSGSAARALNLSALNKEKVKIQWANYNLGQYAGQTFLTCKKNYPSGVKTSRFLSRSALFASPQAKSGSPYTPTTTSSSACPTTTPTPSPSPPPPKRASSGTASPSSSTRPRTPTAATAAAAATSSTASR